MSARFNIEQYVDTEVGGFNYPTLSAATPIAQVVIKGVSGLVYWAGERNPKTEVVGLLLLDPAGCVTDTALLAAYMGGSENDAEQQATVTPHGRITIRTRFRAWSNWMSGHTDVSVGVGDEVLFVTPDGRVVPGHHH